MKVLFIYNKESIEDKVIMNRIQKKFPSYLHFIEINTASTELRNLVRATPAILYIPDNLQGEYLKGENIDGELLAIAKLHELIDNEEKIVHNSENHRLDIFINNEKKEVIDKYTIELMKDGVI